MALGLGTTVAGGSPPVVAAVSISWTAPSAGPSLTNYRIYKSTDGGTTYSELATVASGTTSTTVDALAGDKIKVVAYNGAGESDDSNVITII